MSSNVIVEWTAEEDERFMKQIQICGTHNWKVIADYFPGKTAKHCRLRWHNHLNPEIRRIAWSPEEDRVLLHYHGMIGNKWARIAKLLKGRTDNQVKNRFYSLSRPTMYKKPSDDVYPESPAQNTYYSQNKRPIDDVYQESPSQNPYYFQNSLLSGIILVVFPDGKLVRPPAASELAPLMQT